ncbi:MAG: phytanoyl-CoA dioxygenase family protein [Polyangiaceae bacterium]
MRIEDRRFHWEDPAGREHFAEHGHAIVSGVLDAADREEIERGWNDVVTEAADACGLVPERFVERFPQNRDLWRKSARFRRLLFETRQADVARRYLGVSGVRLFHDHAILKPVHASGSIPWHQDSAYWPVDRVGLSLWTPTHDVPADGGCLEVLDTSHRDGPAAPQDFLAGGGAAPTAEGRRLRLPVRRGETVVLNGLCWHASGPNVGTTDRLAYLTLWVPSTARFVPEHAGWHPTAAHVAVPPGARLDGDWFPLFGSVPSDDEGELVQFPQPAARSGPSMFTASRDIAEQIVWLLGVPSAPLARLLEGDGPADITRTAVAAGLCPDAAATELRAVLDDLKLQDHVRRRSVARDVYLRSVSRWWALVGARVDEERNAG